MSPFDTLIDLAGERLGGRALWATDEFFAEKENLLKPGRGEFIAGKYTDHGKWMDGWESRRKREPGHDTCLIKLGVPGVVRGVDIDTNHFIGNFPEFASIDGIEAPADTPVDELLAMAWTELLPMQRLQGGSRNLFAISSAARSTHVRLHIYPDGGVARLRVHGDVSPDWHALTLSGEPVNLAASEYGAAVILANEEFFGTRHNLLLPGESTHMGDGWETRRKRGPGNDWAVVRLARPGVLSRVVVDTRHFKGNFPHSCSIEACHVPASLPDEYFASRSIDWRELLPRSRLRADTAHVFTSELWNVGLVSHLRLSIYPDGGVARLRAFGTVT